MSVENSWVSKVKRVGDCLEWHGNRHSFGYGIIELHGKKLLAHRVAYFLEHGQAPRVVRHKCDNPCCVEITHLEGGIQADNVRDMDERGRRVNAPHHGVENGRAKLNETQVLAIRHIYKAGFHSQSKIGLMFGVTQNLVSKIVRRDLWRHV